MELKWNKQFTYPKSVRELINEKRHYVIGNEKLPSVTTILSATQSQEKQDSLKNGKLKLARLRQNVLKIRQVHEVLKCTQYWRVISREKTS
jgi:hypothetical protein